MLLKAIEEKTFRPLGAAKDEHSDFQLICGTNRDLSLDVADRRFRADLLARINLWSFDLPGLADRRAMNQKSPFLSSRNSRVPTPA